MSAKPPSYTKLVSQALQSAKRPLTVNEICERVQLVRPIESRNPAGTVRNAMNNEPRAVTLGGRPAHYTWWPRHLVENAFRQPLRRSDLAAGTLVVDTEVRLAMWPDFFANRSRHMQIDTMLQLADGPELEARILHLKRLPGEPEDESAESGWGIEAGPELAAWFSKQGAAPEDDLIVRVVDVEAQRYALALDRDPDRAAIAARNRAWADVAEQVVRGARGGLLHFELIARAIGHNAYRDPVPPDPCLDVVRDDLRFVVDKFEIMIDLAARIVSGAEDEIEVPPDPSMWPQPEGRAPWTGRGVEGYDEETRLAWARYLFDQGMEFRWAGWNKEAEAYYSLALQLDDEHADAWVHIGNRRYEEGQIEAALAYYQRGIDAGLAQTIGDPETYEAPFWLDLDSRPFMRAQHGKGLCLWRLERVDEARAVFEDMMRWNPNDNQGVRFLLEDLDEGLSLEESIAREEERWP